jgi:hypothetical protein
MHPLFIVFQHMIMEVDLVNGVLLLMKYLIIVQKYNIKIIV